MKVIAVRLFDGKKMSSSAAGAVTVDRLKL